MSDVRALLAAERQSRRISHPHLTYTKSGQLLCNVCQLNVKSETLWEGHLRSANHKKNAIAAQEASSRNLKRKLDEVAEVEDGAQVEEDGPRMKKQPKSRAVSLVEGMEDVEPLPPLPRSEKQQEVVAEGMPVSELELKPPLNAPPSQDPRAPIDEDEWAAFEREVVPLAQADFSAATITAAPVTAEELARRKDEERRKQLQNEAAAEREEEEERILEEVEIMEDLNEKVKKLREKREALRIAGNPRVDTGQPSSAVPDEQEEGIQDGDVEVSNESSDDVDDWYS
jgi:zinc finger protein 830